MMGILSDADFEKEISNSVPSVIVQEKPSQEKPGRKEGDLNVPDSLRKVIGEHSVTNGRSEALALAKMFGVSDSSVSAYANGATSTSSYNKPKRNILEVINRSKERITRRAQQSLHQVFDNLTNDKLQESNAKDLSSIAKDMSVVIKNMEPSKEAGQEKNAPVTFVIMRPEMRQISEYPIIDLRE